MYKDLKSSAVLRQITVDTKKSAALSTGKDQTKKAKPVKKTSSFYKTVSTKKH